MAHEPRPDKDQIIQAYIEGEPLKLIAERHGITMTHVVRLARESGYKQKRIGKQKVEILTLHTKGLSRAEIAQATGYTPKQISTVICRATNFSALW